MLTFAADNELTFDEGLLPWSVTTEPSPYGSVR